VPVLGPFFLLWEPSARCRTCFFLFCAHSVSPISAKTESTQAMIWRPVSCCECRPGCCSSPACECAPLWTSIRNRTDSRVRTLSQARGCVLRQCFLGSLNEDSVDVTSVPEAQKRAGAAAFTNYLAATMVHVAGHSQSYTCSTGTLYEYRLYHHVVD